MLAPFFCLSLPCENKSSILAAALLHSHCARIPMATDMCNSLPSPFHPSTRRALSSLRNSVILRGGKKKKVQNLPQWSTKLDAVGGGEDVFLNHVLNQNFFHFSWLPLETAETEKMKQKPGSMGDRWCMLLWYGEAASCSQRITVNQLKDQGLLWHTHTNTHTFSLCLSLLLPALSDAHCSFLHSVFVLTLTFAVIMLWIGVTAPEEVSLTGKPPFPAHTASHHQKRHLISQSSSSSGPLTGLALN